VNRSRERQFPRHKADSRARGAIGFILAGLLLAMNGGACGPAAAPEPTAALGSSARPGNPLAGTEWQLVSLRGEGLLADTYISLNFEEEELGGFAGCNHYGGGADGGGYTITPDGGLAIPVLARTAIACLGPRGVMEQEDAYFEALTAAEAYHLEGSTLSLLNAAGNALLDFDLVQQSIMDPAELPGTVWQLVSVDGEPPLAGSMLTLAFHGEQRAGGHAGCRDYVMSYQADETGLTFLSTAMIGEVCASEDLRRQEGEYTTILGWTTRFSLQAERLELHTARGEVLTFEPLSEAARPSLQGPTWSLLAFVAANPAEGVQAPVPLPFDLLPGTEIMATFADGQFSGTGGCNHYGGSYQIAGTTLSISDLYQTEMACPNPKGVMAQEQRYLDNLRQASVAHVYGTRLWLETSDGQALVFAPGP
jgi:heat shock protein HslJ